MDGRDSRFREALVAILGVFPKGLSYVTSSQDHRYRARRAILSLGEAAFPSVEQLLQGDSITMQYQAIVLIGELGPPASRFAPRIAECLSNPTLADASARALGNMGTNAIAQAPKLVSWLKASKGGDAFGALYALRAMSPFSKVHVPELVRFANDASADKVARAVAYAVVRSLEGEDRSTVLFTAESIANYESMGWRRTGGRISRPARRP